MLLKKALLTLPLLFMVHAPTLAQSTGPVSVGATSNKKSGPMAGKWNLPNRVRRGHMAGVLENKDGKPIMKISAKVERDRNGSTGTLKGHAEILRGPKAGRKLPFVGRWQLDSKGKGSFSGKLLGKKQKGTKRRVVIRMKGGFQDGRIMGGPGKFKGRWRDV